MRMTMYIKLWRFMVCMMFCMLCLVGAGTPYISSAYADEVVIVAEVNDYAITSVELQERINFVRATSEKAITKDQEAALREQVLRNLIDERLQMQVAASKSITITQEQVQQAVRQLEKQRGKEAGSLVAYLQERGVDPQTFYAQLEAQLAWNMYVGRHLARSIIIAPEDIDAEATRLRSKRLQQNQFQIAALLVPARSAQDVAYVQQKAEQLAIQIRRGDSMEALVQEGSTIQYLPRSWMQDKALSSDLRKALETKKPGDVVVLPTARGAQVVQLIDRRMLSVDDAMLQFRDISFKLGADAGKEDVDLLMNIAKEVAENPGTCEQDHMAGVESLEGLEIDITLFDSRRSELSPEIAVMVDGLAVGEVSDPFATSSGIHLLMLCGEKQLKGQHEDAPLTEKEREIINDRLVREQLNLESLRAIRELRQSAYIDIRQ